MRFSDCLSTCSSIEPPLGLGDVCFSCIQAEIPLEQFVTLYLFAGSLREACFCHPLVRQFSNQGGRGRRQRCRRSSGETCNRCLGFFHPSLFARANPHAVPSYPVFSKRRDRDCSFPHSRKVCFGSSLNSKVGMNTCIVNCA